MADKPSSKHKGGSAEERRRSKRTSILESFSLFVVVPSKGPLRLKVHDLSDMGIGFDLDIEEEGGSPAFSAEVGQSFDVQLFLNQSLYLPLTVDIRRIMKGKEDGVRRLGAEFHGKSSKGHVALLAFLDLLEALTEAGSIEA